MNPIAWINSLTFHNGSGLALNPDSIVVFVGPNNSGKSRILREIAELPIESNPSLAILNRTSVTPGGSVSDFLATLEHRRVNNQYYYPGHNNASNADQLTNYWNSLLNGNSHGLKALAAYFLKYLDTTSRLELTNPASAIDLLTSLPSHPIQSLQADEEKERLFSRYFQLAFGEEAIVNHGAGSSVPLHIGSRPLATAEHDRVSKAYQTALRQLPLLHQQGDGMKSFAGLFLTLYVENYSINLIDEPEAFLHPPQAMLLGQMVAQILGSNKQLFISTHSEHFLKGLLATASDRLIIVRLQRDGLGNKIKLLDNASLTNIQNDSLLRYSNVLDGIFHKKVVLAESDADCKFYNAISAAIIQADNLPAQDILFVQTGGKHRFKIVVKALKSLDVPLIVIGDFDFFHDENPTKGVYEELGGIWADVSTDFQVVRTAINQKRPELETVSLRAEIDQIFVSFSDTVIPETKIKEIQAALKKSSPWSQAKASGKAYLPAGDATQAFNRVQEAFIRKRFIILELGEIEAFDKSVGGHGPHWVNNVLEKDILNSPDLASARDFVRRYILG